MKDNIFSLANDYLTNKYFAVLYKYSSIINNNIQKNSHEFVKSENIELLSKKIVSGLVPYNLPSKKLTSKYNILFSSKRMFNDDILYGPGKSNIFNCYQYSRMTNRKLAYEFMPKNISHFNYKSNNNDHELNGAKIALREFYSELFFFINKKIKFDAMLVGNFGAFDEQELATALLQNDISFYAFHKECMLSSGWEYYLRMASKHGREPFKGSRIFVYNNVTKNMIIKSGICPSDKVEILGMTRIDRIHEWRKKNSYNKLNKTNRLGVFFTQPTAQLPSMIKEANIETLYDVSLKMKWTELVNDTNRVLYDFSINNPMIEVVVKVKRTHYDIAKNIYSEYGETPNNLILTTSINALDLIISSDIIFSFNSTSVLETIAAGIPCVTVRFGEALKKEYQKFLLDFGDVPYVAKSPDELYELLDSNLKADRSVPFQLPENARDVLTYWTNNPDGGLGKTMCIRLAEVIEFNRKGHSYT